MDDKKIVVRTRGIILCEGELLVVKHSFDHNYYALPGGHLEYGETILECIEREIIEELGIKPEIGRLLYIHDYIDENDGVQSVEFFFEIVNSKNYKNIDGIERTHAHEIVELLWIKPEENEILLPKEMGDDFKKGKILSDVVRYIKE